MHTLTFGKYKGWDIQKVFEQDTKYIQWISQKSSNPIAVKAADAVIAKQRQQDNETDQQLAKALRDINKQKSRQGLVPYKHVWVNVRDNVADINLCTHQIHWEFGLTEEAHSADWDAVSVVMGHDDLAPYDEEEDENAWKRPIPLGPIPKPEDTIWYPIDAQHSLLSSQAMTLEQCIDFLDEYLLKKQKPEEEKEFSIPPLSKKSQSRYSSKWYSKDEIEQMEEHDQAIENEREYWESQFAIRWKSKSGPNLKVSLWCHSFVNDGSYYFSVEVNGGEAYGGKTYEHQFEDIKPYSNPEYPEIIARIGKAGLTQEHYDALMAVWNRRSEWHMPPA